MDLLTTAEAARYLRIRERKLYELVAEAAIPCTKVTGKWLFPRADLDRWVLAGMHRPEGLPAAAPLPVVGGSHDPLLEWALRASASGLAVLPEGSEAGFSRFLGGEIVAAGLHLHSLVGNGADDANVAAVKAQPSLADAVLIGFAEREQGLLVAAGNPLDLRALRDVARRRARLARRPDGAGAQLLLLSLLQREGLDAGDLLQGAPLCPTGGDVAQAIRAGRADCGVATRATAAMAGLDFLPLAWERFDLVMRQRDYFRPPLQALMTLLRAEEFVARAGELGGYRTGLSGSVRFAP